MKPSKAAKSSATSWSILLDQLGRVVLVFGAFGILQRGRDLLLGQPRAVIAFDQERDAAAFVDVPRPAHRFIEHAEFLVEVAILLRRRDAFRATRAGINPIGHGSSFINAVNSLQPIWTANVPAACRRGTWRIDAGENASL